MQLWFGGPRAALADQGYAQADLEEALSYRRGARVRHRVDVLNTNDEPTGEVLQTVRKAGGSVTWSYRHTQGSSKVSTDAVAVRRKATVHLTQLTTLNVLAHHYRVVTEFQMLDGVWVPWWLGTFRTTLPPLHDDGVIVSRQLALVDKSGRWNEKTLNEAQVIETTENVLDVVKNDLTNVFGETTFAFPQPTLANLEEDMFFPVGTPYLVKWNRLFSACGLGQVIADEAGVPTAHLLSDLANQGSEHKYGPGEGKIKREGSLEALVPELPNVLKYTSSRGPTLPELGNGITYRRNEDTGPGSISARGGGMEAEEEMEVVTDVTSHPELEAYADSDSQRLFAGGGDRFVGKIALNPRHSDRDVCTFHRPRLGLHNALMNVTSWTYPLNEITNEEAVLMNVEAERRVEVTAVNS